MSIVQDLGGLLGPLASATTAVKAVHGAYNTLFERITDIENTKILRLNRSIDVVKGLLRNPAYNHSPSPKAQVVSLRHYSLLLTIEWLLLTLYNLGSREACY
jgi:hypothetical protein